MRSKIALDPYWSEIYRIAKDLRQNDSGFWRSFRSLHSLMAWLHYRGKCAYCEKDLIQEKNLIGGSGLTDHLLCSAKSNIGFTSHLNAVPACSRCNSIKAKWDREKTTMDFPEVLTQELHNRFVSEARDFIKAKQTGADAKFESDKANWEKALKERDAIAIPVSN